MCASYGLQIPAGVIFEEFEVFDEKVDIARLQAWMDNPQFDPVRPTGINLLNLSPLIREVDGRPIVEFAWWQLWVNGARPSFQSINARDDALLTRWSRAVNRRALAPAANYFEPGANFFHSEHRPFALAAIYTVENTPAGEIPTYAVVTQEAVPRFHDIHDRMPLLIPRQHYGDWLDPSTRADRVFLEAMVAASREFSDEFEFESRPKAGSSKKAPAQAPSLF